MESQKVKKLAAIPIVLLILAAAVWFAWNQEITNIIVEGNEYYAGEEIINRVFQNEKERHTIYAFWNQRFGKKHEIPFVQDYSITITGIHSAHIMIYEKKIIGYLSYMGSCLYFDSDGYIVESSAEKREDVLCVEGIPFDSFAVDKTLPVSDSSVFHKALIVSQLLEKEQIKVDSLRFSKLNEMTMYMGKILVELGTGEHLEEEIHALSDIYPQIKDEEGTLYLDRYSVVNNAVEYIFRRKQVEETESEETESAADAAE